MGPELATEKFAPEKLVINYGIRGSGFAENEPGARCSQSAALPARHGGLHCGKLTEI